MSAIVMADVYGKNIAKNKPDPTKMLFIGRLTMVVATLIGVILASFSMDILIMLVFVGALWGAIVFPVIASCFWNRVTNAAFTSAVVAGLLMFCIARFELLPMVSAVAVLFELLAAVGGGVVLGLMTFGFCGRRVGLIVGAISAIGLAFLCVGFLRDYTVLLASLMAYGVSTIVCIAVSLMSSSEFDFSQIDQNVINYDPAKPAAEA